ncbi:hypothetical protein J6590_096880 [Homalodisca vitripennis]|nr:hypothetical protein J6590_096880 [Homalodisca vitripennis]
MLNWLATLSSRVATRWFVQSGVGSPNDPPLIVVRVQDSCIDHGHCNSWEIGDDIVDCVDCVTRVGGLTNNSRSNDVNKSTNRKSPIRT